ncbi:MAG: IclR family transcriptional regulator [Pseudomonadota bacterium]
MDLSRKQGAGEGRGVGVQSVHRAVSLLRVVARHNDNGIRLTPLCKEVGLKPSTAYQLLATLVKEGFVTHDPYSKLYNLGLDLFTLGSAAHQFALRDYLQDTLERIARRTGDTVYLVMRSGTSCLYLSRLEGAFPVRTLIVDVGARRPLGIGAGSLALMAWLPDDQVERIIQSNAGLYADYNHQTPEDVRRLVIQTRKQGYALNDRQVEPQVVGVGLPLHDDEGQVVAAISVGAIPTRMNPDRRKEIVRIVKEEVAGMVLPSEKRGGLQALGR